MGLLCQSPFSYDEENIDDGGHAEEGGEEDTKSGGNIGLVQNPLLEPCGPVDAREDRAAEAGREEGHAHKGADGDDGAGAHSPDAADAVAGSASVGTLGAEAGQEATDSHHPKRCVGGRIKNTTIGGVEVGKIDQ